MPLSSPNTFANKSLVIREEIASTSNELDDNSNAVEINSAAASTFTVEPDTTINMPVGAQIIVSQTGAGQITFTAGAGVIINSSGALFTTKNAFSVCTLYQSALNNWVLMGDLV